MLLFLTAFFCLALLVIVYSAHPWLALSLQSHATLPYRLLLFSSPGDCIQVPVYTADPRLALPLQSHAALPLLLPLPLRGKPYPRISSIYVTGDSIPRFETSRVGDVG